MRELWECPSCGRRFVNPQQWHSCGSPGLDEALDDASVEARAVFERIDAALRAAGEFRVHPQKTRIAFISRMTFASVKLARRWVDLVFVVDGPIDDERIRRIELYGPTSFGHHVRLAAPDDVDDDVHRWLARAHRRGDQETLDPAASVEPAVGRPLEVLLVPVRARVVESDDRLGLSMPRHVAEVFDAHPAVLARVGGERYPGRIDPGAGPVLLLDVDVRELGLGVGDTADVYLTADL